MNVSGASIIQHANRRGVPVASPNVFPAFVTTPVIDASPNLGVVATYTQGIYTGNPTPAVTQHWTLDGVDIAGATGATYTPVVGNQSHVLAVRQIITNALGSVSSTSTGLTVLGLAPSFSTAPTLNSTPTVGAPVSYTPGSLTAIPAATITQQWTLDGADISGATGATYTPVSGDATHLLRIREIATNILGSANSTSASGTVSTGAPGALSTTFTLTSPNTATAPFTIAHAFRQGDVSSAQDIAVTGATAQVVYKNAWPDGSRKLAIISGTASLTANTPKTVSLAVGTASSGTALTTGNLKTAMSGQTCSIACGSFGTVSWATTDFDSPFGGSAWVSGAQMSSWIYRKPMGSDPHLVGWLEVRLYASGAVEVLPWIENGYLRVAAPTNKSATYTFTLGAAAPTGNRFSQTVDLKHHTRTPLISGTILSHWLGTDPAVTPKHDTLYMQATELVPSYRATVSPTFVASRNAAGSFTPLQQGDYEFGDGFGGGGGIDTMSTDGYGRPIGLLPEWDVCYLTSTSPTAYPLVIRNAWSAGRYSIHHRDEATNLPFKPSSWPTLVGAQNGSGLSNQGASTTSTYCPDTTGGQVAGWDSAHAPSVGFLAYLVTGWHYFMEEVQFAAGANYLTITDWLRGGGSDPPTPYVPRSPYTAASMICAPDPGNSVQTRQAAWNFRTLSQALCVTPDSGDPMRAEYIAQIQDNINFFNDQYVIQTGNPTGFVQSGEDYPAGSGDRGRKPPWQQDFLTASWGYSKALGLPIASVSQAKMDAFFQWTAKSVVNRLGTSSEFWYINANRFTLRVSSSTAPDFLGGTGPWYSTPAAMYAQAVSDNFDPSGNPLGSTEGVLAYEYEPTMQASAQGQWGELQMAISYAVRHGVSGASAGYGRMTGASNWNTLSGFWNTNFPVMGVKPKGALPAWLSGQPLNKWFEITGATGAGGAPIASYSGMAINPNTSEILIAAAGGHSTNYDNRVVGLSLLTDSPSWTLRHAASTSGVDDVAYYPDGLPASRHTYWSTHFVPQRNRLMLIGFQFGFPNAHTFPTVDGFNLDTNTWDAAGTWANITEPGYGQCIDPSGNVWSTVGTKVYKWSAATATQSVLHDFGGAGEMSRCSVWDAGRNQLVSIGFGNCRDPDPTKTFNAWKITPDGLTRTALTLTGSAATQFATDAPYSYAMEYDPDNDRILIYAGGLRFDGTASLSTTAVYVITPTTGSAWDISVLPVTGVTPDASTPSGLFNRFRYVPALKGFVYLCSSGTQKLYFLRTA